MIVCNLATYLNSIYLGYTVRFRMHDLIVMNTFLKFEYFSKVAKRYPRFPKQIYGLTKVPLGSLCYYCNIKRILIIILHGNPFRPTPWRYKGQRRYFWLKRKKKHGNIINNNWKIKRTRLKSVTAGRFLLSVPLHSYIRCKLIVSAVFFSTEYIKS